MAGRTASVVAMLASTLVVGSCGESNGPHTSSAEAGGLDVSADVSILESFPVQLRGRLTVENPTGDAVSFDVGGCPVFLRVYREGGRGPVWDQADGAVCTMVLRSVTLEPGAVEVFDTPTVGAREILGDDLPDGAYRAAVYLAFARGGEREAEADDVDLAIPR